MPEGPMDMLVAALRTDDRLVQAEAARLLGELRSPKAVGPLLDYVRYSRWHAKTAGFHALAEIGDRSVCDVIRPLVDLPNCSNDWYWYGCKGVRTAAAVALLRLGDEGGVAYLEEQAERDDDVFYAWFAPSLLRMPDDPPAAARLKGLITVEALGRRGSRGSRETDPGILTMVAETLGVLGSAEACERLTGLLSFHSRYVRGQAALSLLEAAPSGKHVEAVSELADSDPTDFARIKASLALCRAEVEEYAVRLRAALRDCEDSFDRAVAVQATGTLGDAQDCEAVSTNLSDPDPYVRQCAVEALERIGGDEAQEAIIGRWDDPDIRVRMQVAKSQAAREGEV